MAADFAQYAIDIAAQMSGGEQTSAQLDALTEKLSGSGKGAEFFQRAMQQVSAELDVARTASASANTALADGVANYKSLELASLQLAKAQEKAERETAKLAKIVAGDFADGMVEELAASSEALRKAQDDEARLASELRATTTALDAQGAAMKGLESAATAATAKEKALAVQLGNVRTISSHVDKSLAGQAESLAKVQGALGQIGGPLGRLGQLVLAPAKGFADLKASMGAGNAAALVAAAGLAILVVAVVALTVAVVAGVVGIAKWGIGLADARREAELTAEAVAQLNPDLGAAASNFARLTRETGQTTSQLSALAKSLLDAKVSAEDMPAALRAAAQAETALGQGGAAAFVAQLRAGKLTVQDFANTVESKFGGIVQRQMLGLGMQSEQLKRNFSDLFSGLQIDSVLAGMQTIVGLFDKTTASGRALEMFFGKVFQPLIDNAEAAAYVVEAFVLGFLIGLTQLYLAVKPAIKFVSELFGFDDVSLRETLDAAVLAGQIAAVVFAGFAVVLTAIVGVFAVFAAAAMVVEGAVFAVLGAVVYLASNLMGALRSAFVAVVDYVRSINWGEIGTNIMLGLARGITGSAGAVLGAIGGVVSGAISSAKRLLGIASPSKVFAQIGDFTGEGFVEGLDGQQQAADAAMGALVEPPAEPLAKYDALSGSLGAPAPAKAATAAQAAPAAASVSVTGPFNFYGVEGAEDAEARFSEVVTRILEGDAASLGAEVAA